MKKLVKKKSLQRQILASVLALGMINVCGVEGAERINEGKYTFTLGEKVLNSTDLSDLHVVSNDERSNFYQHAILSNDVQTAKIILDDIANICVESKGEGQSRAIFLVNDEFIAKHDVTIESTTDKGQWATGFVSSNSKNEFQGNLNIVSRNNNLENKGCHNYGEEGSWNDWQASRVIAFDVEGGSVTDIYGKATIRAEGASFNQAIYSYQAETTFHDDADISASSSRYNGFGEDVRVINLEGDSPDIYKTSLKFLGNNTKITGEATNGNIIGVYSSGGPDRVSINFAGKDVSVDVYGKMSSYGILSQYSGSIKAEKETDVKIKATADLEEAIGIFSGEYNGSSGNIYLDGNVVVTSSGKYSYSVVSEGIVSLGSTGKTVSLTGDVVAQGGEISLNGSNNSVVGDIAAIDGGIVNLTAGNGVYNVQQMYAEERGVINVGKDTTLNVSSEYLTGEEYLVYISDDGELNVDDSAKLRILNAEKGQEFNIVQGSNKTKWLLENISADNFMLQYEQKEDSSDYIITTVVADAAEVFDGAVIIPKALTQNLRLADKGDAAFDFFTAVTDSNNFTKEQAINAINSAADMHELGGVNHAAYSVHNAMTDAVAEHLSLAVHEHDGHEHDKDIWAHYIHNKENIRGMNLGGLNANYDLQYNGIVVGSDLYNKGKAVAGLALSYADGSVNSGTASSHTRNEADYYGISLYGRIKNGGSALLGDISYMHGSNDLTQHNSGHDITASVKTDAFSVGVKAEQEFKTGAGRVVPYAGLRYMHLGAGSYTNSLGLHYDADEQNLLLLPVGVAYSCELKKASWSFRPVIDLGYVWTMGDREADMTVSLNGASDGFGFNTADSGSFVSRFALEAEKNNITYGLGYEYQKGDSVKANKWLANLTVSF